MKSDVLMLLTILVYVLVERQFYFCQCLDLEKDNTTQTKNILSIKATLQNVTDDKNSSIIETYATLQHTGRNDNTINITDSTNISVTSSADQNIKNVQLSSSTLKKQQKELPVALIIAGPTAAVSIFLFLCIAYYFHNAQLNRKAKRLSVTLYVPPDLNSISSNCSSPSVMAPSQKFIQSARLSRDSDLLGPRKKSMASIHTLSIPPNIQGKRGSNWSALADQEILTLSAPRRHSTFIL